jgi:hypothetical protein
MKKKQNKKNKSKKQFSHLTKFIGIDPGKSGGITLISDEGIESIKCPKEPVDMAMFFQYFIGNTAPHNVGILIERVWARPTNGSRHAFAYGFNYGLWFGIIAMKDIELHTTLPSKWIQYFDCPKGMEYNERKKWLKEKAKKLYPNIKRVTLAMADSILIAHYAKEEFFNK